MQFLFIGRVPEGVAAEQVMSHVQPEAQKVWEEYSAEVVRSIHYIADMSGAVLMCEAESLSAMQKIVEEFPMVKAGVLKIEVLPLKPYTGLESLFAKS
ncbi:hypothetical protein Riv7116_5622 [Rivularia sp. PCC 7116]|uniref:hypothetical protein n=1 Tax=Rivularia sp. PCC 7116 TaxID=373994 RepID=UPI00029F3421|nr:hypothetical protein [Rivularia sp. PCC 7116]AFY57991.1 hypothetical protein Riv7116_5622 [Rivularia sp. PCC 7116]